MTDDRIEVPPRTRDDYRQPYLPPQRRTAGEIELMSRPNIVNIVYVVGLFTALPLLIGAVLAYVWKGDPQTMEWERSHMRYHVRTFWLSIAYHVLAIAMILSLILLPFGFLLWAGAFIFTVIRCIKSFSRAQQGQPMENERTWLW